MSRWDPHVTEQRHRVPLIIVNQKRLSSKREGKRCVASERFFLSKQISPTEEKRIEKDALSKLNPKRGLGGTVLSPPYTVLM